MKIKLDLKKTVLIIALLLLVSVAIYLYIESMPVTVVYYNDYKFEFRDDVKAADKVPFFASSEKYPRYMFESIFIPYINIVYLESNNSETNKLYPLAAFELTYKLSIIAKTKGLVKIFNATSTNSTVKVEPETGVLRIMLIPPEFTDKTQVVVGENEIRIYGKDDRDFDLAVIKTILVLAEIDVNSISRLSLLQQK